MREAFGWNLEQYIFHSAYPGAAELIDEPERPALLRRLFQLGCAYSGQILILSENDGPAYRCGKFHHCGSLP
jgi:hypothetical protein